LSLLLVPAIKGRRDKRSSRVVGHLRLVSTCYVIQSISVPLLSCHHLSSNRVIMKHSWLGLAHILCILNLEQLRKNSCTTNNAASNNTDTEIIKILKRTKTNYHYIFYLQWYLAQSDINNSSISSFSL
jgi:glutamine phosphoribosylpyrophosphate amidotransferase